MKRSRIICTKKPAKRKVQFEEMEIGTGVAFYRGSIKACERTLTACNRVGGGTRTVDMRERAGAGDSAGRLGPWEHRPKARKER